MSIRIRSRTTIGPGGTSCRSGSNYNHSSVIETDDEVTDEVTAGDNRQFNAETISKIGGRANGGSASCAVGQTGWFNNFMLDYYRNTLFTHQSLPDDLGDTVYITRAAARTNPSRPYVDVVANALQLPEILMLLRKKGDSIIRNRARENLAYQFGFKPLASDLLKISNFSDQVANRVKELERLRSGNGLRRTIALGGLADLERNTALGSLTVHTVNRTFTSPSGTNQTKLRVGAHCRWKPGIDLHRLDPGVMGVTARKAVLGLKYDFVTAWELIPWTWLLDWGGTIGTYLMANRNIVSAVLSESSITRHTRTVYTRKTNPTNGISVSDFVFTQENKRRYSVTIAPTAHFPFLSGNQMGILASLAIVKG
jgi:hypothetical protein